MEEKPKRGSLVTLLAVAVALFLLYALSYGPVIATQKGRPWVPDWERAVTWVIYEPLHWAVDFSPPFLRQKFLDYARWWAP